MYEIVTESSLSTGSVRGHEFPVLEAGNFSFPNGRYIVRYEPLNDESSFNVIHRIENAKLINIFISKRLVKFVCTVSSPASSYRESHQSKTEEHVVSWDENDLGEPPLLTPMIVMSEPYSLILDHSLHEVHELWHKQKVDFQTGMKLAVGSVVHLRSSIQSLLTFHESKDLGMGQFHVKPEEQEGFSFRVELSSDLHQFLKYNNGDPSRSHIISHITSVCYSILQSKYSNDDDEEGGWSSYSGLRAVADYLHSKGLPHWSDDGFVPELVATKLHPHKIIERDNQE